MIGNYTEEKSDEEMDKYFKDSSDEDKIIQFLINALICSAYDIVTPESCLNIVQGLCDNGCPPVGVFKDMAKMTADTLGQLELKTEESHVDIGIGD